MKTCTFKWPLISFIVLVFVACKDLDRIDFVGLEILEVESLSLSEVNISAKIEGANIGNIIRHGFVWSDLNSDPELNSVTANEIQLGALSENTSFNANLENLNINATYFVKAFAEVNNEIFYSDVFSFTNEDRVTLQNFDIKIIKGTTNALVFGAVDGLLTDEAIEQYGHCWSETNQEPVISDNSTSLGNAVGNIQEFSSTLINLIPQKNYFVRSYAIISGIEIYGPVLTLTKNNYWVEKNGLPGGGVKNAEYFSIDGKGYFVLGDRGNNSNELWEYDPASDTWNQRSSFPGTWRQKGFGLHKERKIYIGMGIDQNGNYLNDMWEYDLDTDVWITKSPFVEAQREGTQEMLINGKMYMSFGADKTSTNWLRYDEVWEFDPDFNNGGGMPDGQWTLITTCYDSKRLDGYAFVIDNLGFNFGGGGNTQNLVNEIWAMNPEATGEECIQYNAYSSIEENSRGAAVFATEDYGYVGCGLGTGNVNYDFWEYDPSAISGNSGLPGQWTQLADFANGTETRYQVLGFALNGRLFIGFGIDENGQLKNSLWEYISD